MSKQFDVLDSAVRAEEAVLLEKNHNNSYYSSLVSSSSSSSLLSLSLLLECPVVAAGTAAVALRECVANTFHFLAAGIVVLAFAFVDVVLVVDAAACA